MARMSFAYILLVLTIAVAACSGGERSATTIPDGRPIAGGHLQWLDPSMPNRNTGAS